MALVPKFKELTDAVLEFLRGIAAVESEKVIRAHPWMYLIGLPSDEYFPSFFVIPPSISNVDMPLYGRVIQMDYSIYYVMRIDETALAATNPIQVLEDITSDIVTAIEANPHMGMRDFVDAVEYTCSIENDMTFWARDLSQPFIALKIEMRFISRMQRSG